MFYACAIRFDVKTNLKKILVFEMNLNKGRKRKKKSKGEKRGKAKREAGGGGWARQGRKYGGSRRREARRFFL